jgi:hypothetical protein
MPARLHETFLINIVEEIKVQLRSIQGPSAEFAKEISSEGSTTLKFDDKEYGKHDPDAQFRHSKAQFPGVVIEVSYSQKRKDLDRLADDCILGSDGNIQVVVGLDIEYKASKQATLSVWRPNIITNEAGEEELVSQPIVANQVCKHNSNLRLMLTRGRFSVIQMATQAHLVQEVFDYIFETLPRKPWPEVTYNYTIRLSSLLTNYIRFLSTQKMQRSLLGSIMASSELTDRG